MTIDLNPIHGEVYRPYQVNPSGLLNFQEDEIDPISLETLSSHRTAKVNRLRPFVLALVNDTSNNSCLYDAETLQQHLVRSFTNPMTRQACRVHFFLATTLTDTYSYIDSSSKDQHSQFADSFILASSFASTPEVQKVRKVLLANPRISASTYLSLTKLVLSETPDDSETVTKLISFLERGDKTDRVALLRTLALIEQVKNEFHDNFLVQYYLGCRLQRDGDGCIPSFVPDAILCLQQATALQPNHIDAWVQLGCAHAKILNKTEAQTCFQSALRIEPRQDVPGCQDENIVQACFEMATSYTIICEYEAALYYVERATRTMPRNPRTHKRLGAVLRSLGRLEEAKISFEKALRCGSYSDPSCWVQLGYIAKKLHKFADAKLLLERAVELHPTNFVPKTFLGEVHKQLKNYDQAQVILEEVVQSAPFYVSAFQELAEVHILRGNIAEAKKLLESILAKVLSHESSYVIAKNTLRDIQELVP